LNTNAVVRIITNSTSLTEALVSPPVKAFLLTSSGHIISNHILTEKLCDETILVFLVYNCF